LTRIVRTPEGRIIIDPTGKANGRGAYLCSERACWERAIKRRVLNHALKTEVDAESTQRLLEHAATLEGDTMKG
jgi:hypothetical protein